MSKRWLLLVLLALSPCAYWFLENAYLYWAWLYDVVSPKLLWLHANAPVLMILGGALGLVYLALRSCDASSQGHSSFTRKARGAQSQQMLDDWAAR